MSTFLLLAILSAPQAALPLPSSEPAFIERELRGVIREHAYLQEGTVQTDTALVLFAPIELPAVGGEAPLANVVVVQLAAWSDRAQHAFAAAGDQPVVVRCHLSVSTFWGYRHASCSPVWIRPVGGSTY